MFTPSTNLVEEGKWVLGKTSVEVINTLFIITNETESSLITKPGHWNSKPAEKTIDELYTILELRYENDIEVQIKEVEKRGRVLEMLGPYTKNPKKVVMIGAEINYLYDLHTRKDEML